MAKRSRDVSFSPDADEAASDTTGLSSDPEDLRTTKLAAYDAPTMSVDKHVMQCSLPPHTESLGFVSVQDFELHYAKEHTNRCVDCGKNFPSAHFLNLHLDEKHNPLREASAAKGEKTYACFVLDCEKKCSTPQKRRLHLIDKHNFPKAYNFQVVDRGIDDTNTLLQERRKRRVSLSSDSTLSYRQRSTTTEKAIEEDGSNHRTNPSHTTETKSIGNKTTQASDKMVTSNGPRKVPPIEAKDLDDLESSFAALQFVPRAVLAKKGNSQG